MCTEISINEHLPTLRSYGKKVSHVTEFGVHGSISTIGFLSGAPVKVISCDIKKFEYEHDCIEFLKEKFEGTHFLEWRNTGDRY